MALQNTVFTPARRGPALTDGAGGTSERAGTGKQNDPVLRNVGHKTEDIRLLGVVDQSAGTSGFYNLGQVTRQSVGRYRFEAQTAASATTEPLGAIEHVEAEIIEASAGVFTIDRCFQLEGLVAAQDATQHVTSILAAVLNMDVQAVDFDGAGGDSDVSIVIATSTQATDLSANGYATSTGDLVMLEARGTALEVWKVTRLS